MVCASLSTQPDTLRTDDPVMPARSAPSSSSSYGGEPVLKLPNKKISNIPILLHRLLELYILSKEQVVRASSCGYSLRYQCFY
jgi:hypothetical protein